MKKFLNSMNQQPGKDPACRKSPWRFLFLGAAVLSGGWLMLYGLLGLLANSLPAELSSGEAASIGIIGGADGPTAIFVAGVQSPGFDWDVLLMAAILLVGIAGFLWLGKGRKK